MQRYFTLFILTAFLNMELTALLVEAAHAAPRPATKSSEEHTQPNLEPAENPSSLTLSPSEANAKRLALEERSDREAEAAKEEEFLETLFAPDSIPPASIPVLENALGDMNHDSVVNIVDLLRLRDIVIGRPPAPTAYELTEGDLSGNSTIDSVDLSMMRDALLFKTGLPHTITSAGGQVVGNAGRTTFTIPAGAYSQTKRLLVQDYTSLQFERDIGVSVLSLGNGAKFLAGAKLVLLNPSPNDSVVPHGVSMQESVPPGATVDMAGINAVYNINSDKDGDGLPDPELIGGLEPVYDSTRSNSGGVIAMRIDPPRPVQLASHNNVIIDFSSGQELLLPPSTYECGMYFGLYGSNWPSAYATRYEILFLAGNDTARITPVLTSSSDRSSKDGMRGVIGVIPRMPAGTYGVLVYDRITNKTSNTLTITVIDAVGNIQAGLRDSLLSFADKIDTILNRITLTSIMSSDLPDVQTVLLSRLQAHRAKIDSFRLIPIDSLNQTWLASDVRYFQNMRLNEAYQASIGQFAVVANRAACDNTCDYFWSNIVAGAGLTMVCGLFGFASCGPACGYWAGVACGVVGSIALNWWTAHTERKCRVECCLKKIEVFRDAYYSLGDGATFESKWGCLHFDCYKIGGFDPVSVIRAGQGYSNRTYSQSERLDGVIVRVKNSPIPLSQGTISNDGEFLVPFNLNDGQVTLSAYDPRSGFYDDTIATFTVTNPLTEQHYVRMSFQPDTTVIHYLLAVGEYTQNDVSISSPRYEYRLFIPQSAVGRPLNVALSSNEALTFWLQNPSGIFVHRDSSASCKYFQFNPTVSGTHQITVTYGVSGGDGPFTVGVNYAPYPATPYLCGNIPYDTLYAAYQYIAADNAVVVSGDSLSVQPGTALDFQQGGSITSEGTLHGIGTPNNPITLRPYTSSQRQFGKLSSNGMNRKGDQ